MDTTGGDDPSVEPGLRQLVNAIAREAAMVLAENPDAPVIGLIAASGTTECQRARTLMEQQTGKKLTAESFAGVLPVAALAHILDATFPEDAFKWMSEPGRVRKLQIIVCAKDAVRVVSMDLPGSGDRASQ